MTNIYHHMEFIERYFDNDLDQEELNEFHNRLDSDEEFRKSFETMELLLDGIMYSGSKTTLEEKLKRIEEEMSVDQDFQDKPENDRNVEEPGKQEAGDKNFFFIFWSNPGIYRMAIAASSTLMMVLHFALFNMARIPYNIRLADSYFTIPVSGSGISRSTGTEEESIRNKAQQAFHIKDYQKASVLFAEATLHDPEDQYSMLYAGLSEYLNGEYEQAAFYYGKLLGAGSIYEVQARWYLGLCLLKQDNGEAAIPLFRDIAALGTSRSIQATEILEKLE